MEAVTRRAWKEVMIDRLMSRFTWKGQVKKESNKEVGLALSGSKLSLALFGIFLTKFNLLPLYNEHYLFSEAIKHNMF